MTNKTKILLIPVLTIILVVQLLGVVSADHLVIVKVSSPANVEHDDGTFKITFNINNTGSTESLVSFSLTLVSGTATLVSPTSLTINANEQLTNREAIISFNPNQAGHIAGQLVAKVNNTSHGSIGFDVLINDKKELTITETRAITKTSAGEIEVKNNGNVPLSNIELTDTGDFDVTFSIDNFNLNAGLSQRVTVTAVNLGDVGVEGKSVTITAKASDNTQASKILRVGGSFCIAGEKGGNLEITDFDIENTGDGDDDEWLLLDVIEITVDVENMGSIDVDDVSVELGLFDSKGIDQTNELDFENDDEEEIGIGDLDEDDEETVTFRFRIPADMEDGDYKVFVKAFGDDLGEENECTETFDSKTFESISIERENDEGKFIAFDDIVFTPSEATCRDRVSLMADVFNIGDEDLEDQIQVNLFSSRLNVDESVIIRKDFDQGDRETVNFEFTVPSGLADSTYPLELTADFDFKRGVFRESSDEPTIALLRVVGCAVGGAPSERIAAISAVLDSDAKAGEELVVRATITNLKNERATFSVDATGFQSWASLTSVTPSTLDLDAGESKEVVLTFGVDEDAEGENTFFIEATSNGESERREIGVNIESEAGVRGGFSRFVEGKAFLWVIGIANVLLIILIIVVAVRVSRSKEMGSEEER